MTFERERAFNTLVLVEPIGRWKDYRESRIAGYRFECWMGGKWVEIAAGEVPARVQIHHAGGVTRVFSRRLNEITQSLPEGALQGRGRAGRRRRRQRGQLGQRAR